MWLTLIFLPFLIWPLAGEAKKKVEKDWKGEETTYCSRHLPEPERYRLWERLYFISGWDCDYCRKRVIEEEKNYLTNHVLKKEEHFSLIEKHLEKCKKAQKVINFVDNEKNNNLTYDNEKTLKEKGYHDIEQIKSWGLVNRVILPDLKRERREGVVKVLNVIKNPTNNLQINKYGVDDEVVFLLPRFYPSTPKVFPIYWQKIRMIFFYTIHGNKEISIYEKTIVAFFIWRILKKQENWNYNVYLLENNISRYSTVLGNSSTINLYLALLSAYYQKPISREVAATGFLNFDSYSQLNYCPWCLQEEIAKNLSQSFAKNKVSSVGGLQCKIPNAVQAGVKKLILSAEQKEDYEKTVPFEIREKLTVHYVRNVEELEELFWKGEFS